MSPTNHFCTDRSANECPTTSLLTIFTQRNFVANFLRAKCDFRWKTAVLRFWASFGSLGTTYDFYRAACNADAVLWWDFCPSVRPSVRLSVTRVYCDKTVERSVQIYIPYERTFSLVYWEEEWLVGGDPFYLKFWVNRPPLERNRRFSTDNRS